MGASPKKVKRWRQREPRSKRIAFELGEKFRVVVDYSWNRGRIPKFAVVLIRAKHPHEGWDEICRYDSAHGFAHLDILDAEGKVINKIPLSGELDYKKAVAHAIADFKENHQKYWEDYCASAKAKRQ